MTLEYHHFLIGKIGNTSSNIGGNNFQLVMRSFSGGGWYPWPPNTSLMGKANGYGYLAPHTSSSSTSLGKMVRPEGRQKVTFLNKHLGGGFWLGL